MCAWREQRTGSVVQPIFSINIKVEIMDNDMENNILSFNSFLRLNEATLNLDIPWFQDCIDNVMEDLREQIGETTAATLTDYCKNRNKVLGIEAASENPDDICKPYLKELCYRHSYGMGWDEFMDADEPSFKAIAISQMADEIMRILWGSNTSGTINITSTLPMGEADEENQSENILKPTIIGGEKPIHDFDRFCKIKREP